VTAWPLMMTRSPSGRLMALDYIAGMRDQFALQIAKGLSPGIASKVSVGRI
jgi:dGTP triphosphohydrolase